jgi:hypothetical protein
MKTHHISFLGFVLIATTVFTFSAKAADPQISIGGVTLSWPEVIHKPIGCCETVNMTLSNDSGDWLLSNGFEIRDRFGTIVATNGQTINITGSNFVTINWKAYKIDEAVAPYTLTFYVIPFSSRTPSGSLPISVKIKIPFQALVEGPPPSPAPTIYLTNPADKALSALVKSKTIEVNSLTSKLKKICAVKPKPRGC